MSPVREPESPEEFRYSGWLSFYPFKTHVKGEFPVTNSHEDVQQILRQKLPGYKQGKPHSPGNGFRIANTPDLFEEVELLTHYPFLDELVHIKYVEEEYQQRMAYDEQEDDFTETSVVDISSSDIFWIYPRFLFTRSSKQETERVRARLRSILVNSLRIEKIEFERDFIIWLMYKDQMGEKIGDDIHLQQLQSIKFTGEDDIFGSENQISTLQDSPEIHLLHLLEGKRPESIEAMFEYCGHNIVGNILQNRIQILASKGSPQKLSELERMALSLSFVSEFTALYDEWTTLPQEERYPPISFFKEIYRKAVDEGYETKGISQELLEKYRQLREDM